MVVIPAEIRIEVCSGCRVLHDGEKTSQDAPRGASRRRPLLLRDGVGSCAEVRLVCLELNPQVPATHLRKQAGLEL